MPTWLTPADESSPSTQVLIKLMLARRLSLDPEALMDDGVPIGYLHVGPTKFKHLRLGNGVRRDALTSFGQGVARVAFALTRHESRPPPFHSASMLRESVLSSGRDNVGFGDVLTLCWSLGVPVLHLKLFPGGAKGIAAMAVRIGQRFAILVARESGVAAQYAFHVAHELGHIALGHLNDATAIIDAEYYDESEESVDVLVDDEESSADVFAQTLLTGVPDFQVIRAQSSGAKRGTPSELLHQASLAGQKRGVDPAHVLLSFAYATNEWALATAAIHLLPRQSEAPSNLVNRVFWSQVGTPDDEQSVSFLRAVAPV